MYHETLYETKSIIRKIGNVLNINHTIGITPKIFFLIRI
jgi:hypothetical protein